MNLSLIDRLSVRHSNEIGKHNPISSYHGNIDLQLIKSGYRRSMKKGALETTWFHLQNVNIHDRVLLSMFKCIDNAYKISSRVICIPVGMNRKFSPFLHAVIPAIKKDTLIICPSGNKGPDKVLSPGIYPQVLCVGAVDQNNLVAPFSGRIYNEHGVCIKPEIMAPGVNVEVSFENGESQSVNGTSFACAHVAGVAAAMLEANPQATSHDAKMALYESCQPAEGSRYGVIDAEKALENIKTKMPYAKSEEVIEAPSFLSEKYIDYRLRSQCKRATRRNERAEALVTAKDTRKLMQDLSNDFPECVDYTLFKNFDMAHVKAVPAFYEKLFEQPELEVASAVDINYFDM